MAGDAALPSPGNTLRSQNNKEKRLKYLIKYAILKSMHHNGAFLSDDKNGVLLFLYSNHSNFSFKLIFAELRLLFITIGIKRIIQVVRRELLLKRAHPKHCKYIHLWFIGVNPELKGKGIGAKLLTDLINLSTIDRLSIVVETIQLKEYYQSFGFKVFKKLNKSFMDYSFLIYPV